MMKEEKAAGISLFASAIALMATMASHPTGRELIEHGGTQAAVSHSLGLISIPLALFGFLIVTRILRRVPNLAVFAFITYAVGAMAMLIAATLSGFVASAVVNDDVLFHYTGYLNRSFATVGVVAISLAILLWSIAMIGERLWIAVLGLAIGGATIIAVGSGRLRLNLHGFAIVAISQAIWTICVAVWMLGFAPRQQV